MTVSLVYGERGFAFKLSRPRVDIAKYKFISKKDND